METGRAISLRERIRINLVTAMENAGVNQVQLADKLSISKGTVNNWVRGNNSPDVDMVPRICEVLGISVLSLYSPTEFESPESTNQNASSDISEEARSIARSYDKLDDRGKGAVRVMLNYEREASPAPNTEVEKPKTPPRMKVIPLFGNSFAAGPAEPDFGNRWESMEVDPDSPAEFAVRIHGDSMEPYLKDNQIAYGRRRMPQDGEVGAFLLDGAFLCKQVCIDALGNIYLFSLNRARADDDVTVWHDSGRSLTYFGTILLDQKPPLP